MLKYVYVVTCSLCRLAQIFNASHAVCIMNIIPKPAECEKLGGEFIVTALTKVYCDNIFLPQAQRFVQLVHASCGIELAFSQDISQAQVIFKFNENCADEEYYLMISEGATISASTQAGCFYAVETLRQLLRLDETQVEPSCKNCYVEDAPKFGYRGLSVDICRHFFPLSTLKQIVDLMSRVKLNKLHLHLSDDQGFRFEVEKYPLLNTISCKRNGSEVVEGGKRFVDDKEVSGYLTKDEARQLVEYAAERQIEIIPELDVPGHAVAMIAAYPELSCEGTPIEVRQKWGISKDILCAGNDDTFRFITDVLDEVCQVFPGKFVHLGGDEAPKDRWCNCKKCREKLASLKLDSYDQLQTHFVEQLRNYLEQKGKTVICWNDGIHKDCSNQIVSQVWKPLTRGAGVRQANHGRKTIMSPFFHMYFDYPYAMTPLRKTAQFNALKGVKKSCVSNVLGVEGAIWTEYVATEEKLFFNLLPRMLALAECAWSNNTTDFAKSVANYLPLYDKLNLTYNKHALRSRRNLGIVSKFFKKNSNVELDRQNKSKK